jgi:DNA (cytosine-5)-methyltransferase 1
MIRFIDLFCGIGGFRFGLEQAAARTSTRTECVFSSDIDLSCQDAYAANFGHRPIGDITKVDAADVPDHNLLLAGFPCQAFSIMGHRRGFKDTRGTLFFDIARILDEKKPRAFVLENVKTLAGHQNGKTIGVILETLNELGYSVDYRVFNALHFGLPQKRERIWIVGLRGAKYPYQWPTPNLPMRPLADILETSVHKKHYASKHIISRRRASMKGQNPPTPSIWHENKAGHISAYPYSCALRAGASYNYLLVDGKRRLTDRELLRLQGFPETFKCVVSESQTRKQAGNSLPVNVAREVIANLIPHIL